MKLSDVANKISLLVQAAGCAVLYFIMEAICRRSIGAAYTYMTTRPLVFAYNTAFIFTTMLIVYLSRRRVFWRTLIVTFWLLLALINGILLMNRVTPFTGPDIKNLTDGLAIAKKYLPSYGVTLCYIVLGIIFLAMVVVFFRAPKYQGKMHYKIYVPMVLAGAVGFWGLTQLALEKRILSNYFGNIAFAYEDYGYPYCLATTIFNTGISMPRGYSDQEITRIANTEGNLQATVDEEQRPNIIFVQLESFFDPEMVNYLNISEDPIPFFRERPSPA